MSTDANSSTGAQRPSESAVKVLAMASDRTAMGLLAALDAAGYVVVPREALALNVHFWDTGYFTASDLLAAKDELRAALGRSSEQ